MQIFGEHEQASTRLNFASKSSKGKILQAVKNFNGPFITPYMYSCMHAVIGQFCMPYSAVHRACQKVSFQRYDEK